MSPPSPDPDDGPDPEAGRDRTRLVRIFGAASLVGAVFSVLAVVPPGWYGSTSGDSYVFDPPAFTPLWIERTIQPTITVLAGLLVVLAVAGIYLRDRGVAGRLRRWSAIVATVGLAILAVGNLLLTVGGNASTGADELIAVVVILGGLAAGVAGLAIAVPAMVALGLGLRRAGRERVGLALVLGPLLSTLLVAVAVGGGIDLEIVGAVPTVLPMAIAFAVVGWELRARPDPVPEPPSPTDDPDGAPEAESDVEPARSTGDPPAGSDPRSDSGGPDGADHPPEERNGDPGSDGTETDPGSDGTETDPGSDDEGTPPSG